MLNCKLLNTILQNIHLCTHLHMLHGCIYHQGNVLRIVCYIYFRLNWCHTAHNAQRTRHKSSSCLRMSCYRMDQNSLDDIYVVCILHWSGHSLQGNIRDTPVRSLRHIYQVYTLNNKVKEMFKLTNGLNIKQIYKKECLVKQYCSMFIYFLDLATLLSWTPKNWPYSKFLWVKN